jgi:hypothetical protein
MLPTASPWHSIANIHLFTTTQKTKWKQHEGDAAAVPQERTPVWNLEVEGNPKYP